MSDQKAAVRRVTLDLLPTSTARLKRLKGATDASSYGEVVRAALREYEERIAEQATKVEAP